MPLYPVVVAGVPLIAFLERIAADRLGNCRDRSRPVGLGYTTVGTRGRRLKPVAFPVIGRRGQGTSARGVTRLLHMGIAHHQVHIGAAEAECGNTGAPLPLPWLPGPQAVVRVEQGVGEGEAGIRGRFEPREAFPRQAKLPKMAWVRSPSSDCSLPTPGTSASTSA